MPSAAWRDGQEGENAQEQTEPTVPGRRFALNQLGEGFNRFDRGMRKLRAHPKRTHESRDSQPNRLPTVRRATACGAPRHKRFKLPVPPTLSVAPSRLNPLPDPVRANREGASRGLVFRTTPDALAPGRGSRDDPTRAAHHPRRGYALILVLFALALAVVALAGACRLALEQSVHAARAEEDLQRRWAVTTCQAQLLPRAESVLSAAESPDGRAPPEARRDVRLGRLTLTLVFGDEQAKANVNRLYRTGGLAAADRAVREAVASADGVAVELRPLPDRPKADPDADEEPPAFESLGQVFGRTPSQALVEPRGRGQSPASAVTCWGDGALNFRRATDAAVRAACGRHLAGGELGRVLQMRAKDPRLTAADALDRLKLSDKAREALDEALADESTCHSLWVITHAPGRNWYDLAVADESGEESGRAVLFSW